MGECYFGEIRVRGPNGYKFAQAAKYHLPSRYVPSSHFQSSSFLSLLPPQVPDRGKEEEELEEVVAREECRGERFDGALNEWSARCLEIFHILFTAGGLEPRDRRELAEKPSAWTQLLSLRLVSPRRAAPHLTSPLLYLLPGPCCSACKVQLPA